MTCYIDISTLYLTAFNQLAPAWIANSTILIISQKHTAVYRSCLAIYIQLLEGGFIDSQRSNTSFLGLSQNLLWRQAFLFCQGYQILIVHNQLNGLICLFHLISLHINSQGSYKPQYNHSDENFVVTKLLHYHLSLLQTIPLFADSLDGNLSSLLLHIINLCPDRGIV